MLAGQLNLGWSQLLQSKVLEIPRQLKNTVVYHGGEPSPKTLLNTLFPQCRGWVIVPNGKFTELESVVMDTSHGWVGDSSSTSAGSLAPLAHDIKLAHKQEEGGRSLHSIVVS